MCGGLSFKVSKIPKAELKKFYSDLDIVKFKSRGVAESFYWNKKPALPVKEGKQIKLYDWGNRDKKVNLPQTGWAKKESVDSDKWSYLDPKSVKIPVNKGYEKGIWFKPKRDSFNGLMIEKDKKKHIYMITKQASPKYQDMTHH